MTTEPTPSPVPFAPVLDHQLNELSNLHAREACRRLVGGWNDGLDLDAARAHAEQALRLWYAYIDRVLSGLPFPTHRDFGHESPGTE